VSPGTLTKVAVLLQEKKASVETSAIKGIWNAATGAARAGGEHLISRGNKITGTALKYTPHMALGVGAKKAYDSDAVQRQIYKFKLWKAERDQRKAMGM
jgi:hypothetical protein